MRRTSPTGNSAGPWSGASRIVGEALSKLRKIDEPLATSFTDYRKIISFRNVLIHGYGKVDDELTWAIIETDLPVLTSELRAVLP